MGEVDRLVNLVASTSNKKKVRGVTSFILIFKKLFLLYLFVEGTIFSTIARREWR